MRVDGLIMDFAEHLSEDPNTSPRTAEFYEADLKEFARFLAERGVTEVEDVGVGTVMEFRNSLLGERRKRFTVYRKDAAVRLLRRGATLGELKDALGVRDTSNIGVYKKFV